MAITCTIIDSVPTYIYIALERVLLA